tara:strand:+ start:580 stop:792 length:213 start_codon:yes stop_codon:yes gene_type:complete
VVAVVLDILQVVKVVLSHQVLLQVGLHIQIMEQVKVQAVFQDLGLQHNEQIMQQDLLYKIPVPVVAVVEK